MPPKPEKRVAPSASRNQEPIADILENTMPEHAKVLEIASGTGQHGAYFVKRRPDILWQYSDIHPDIIESQRAYQAEEPDHLCAPVLLDVTKEHWWQDYMNFSTIYCANMIHISPIDALYGLANGAGKILSQPGENLFLYGPFLDGKNSAASNLEFDMYLKSKDPNWGVRDLTSVKHIFADKGLFCAQICEMPRDNLLLIFQSQ